MYRVDNYCVAFQRLLYVITRDSMHTLIKAAAIAAILGTLGACTGPINNETVRDMPTGYLCRILGPDYTSLPSEQRAIYAELERRGEQCMPTRRVVLDQTVQVVH